MKFNLNAVAVGTITGIEKEKWVLVSERSIIKNKFILSFASCIAVAALCFGISMYKTSVVQANELLAVQNQLNTIEGEYNNLVAANNDLKTDYNIMVEHYDGFNQNVQALTYAATTLENQNKELVAQNEEYQKQIKMLTRYSYALVDDAGKPTDIGYDDLVTLDSLLQGQRVNDMDLFLSWIMIESGGKETARNSKSTAKGFGQLLNGTSKWVWTDLLGRAGWHQNVALDGKTNLEMMVALVNRLYVDNGCNLHRAIDNYRGMHDAAYERKFNKYLALSGKSLDSIAANTH
jgi:uncharacterized protein YoxC